jgi:hypothetical protein
MSEENPQNPEFDPSDMMVQFYDNWTKSWAKAMSDTVNNPSFAETLGQQMEGSMDAMRVVRRQVSELMEQYLQQLSLPSRKEVISISERLTKIEMEMDDLDAKLDETLDLLKDIKRLSEKN